MNGRVCLLRVVACILPHEIDRSSFACLCAVAAHTHTAGGTPMISLHSYEESDTITRHHREREREKRSRRAIFQYGTEFDPRTVIDIMEPLLRLRWRLLIFNTAKIIMRNANAPRMP